MTEWIAIGVTVIGGLLGFAVLWGHNKGRMESVNETLKLHAGYHKDHYEHARDDNAHWTQRERGDLAKKLDEIHDEVKDIRKRMYGDSK